MTVVVLGADGMLGRAMANVLGARDNIRLCTRQQWDIGDDAVTAAAELGTGDIVINCAAYTDVDAAETNEKEAMAINGHAPGVLARRCAEVGATLVHFSTDYVFNGHAHTPWAVDAPRDPVNAYGRSKAEGERAIEDSGVDALIVRTSWVYDAWGKNFVRTIAQVSRERSQLRVVSDQEGRPTQATGLAEVTLRLLQRGARGIVHVCDGGPPCTWYALACEVVRHAGSSCNVEPCATREFPRPALRPPYSVLDISQTEALVGPLVPWPTQVATTVRALMRTWASDTK